MYTGQTPIRERLNNCLLLESLTTFVTSIASNNREKWYSSSVVPSEAHVRYMAKFIRYKCGYIASCFLAAHNSNLREIFNSKK